MIDDWARIEAEGRYGNAGGEEWTAAVAYQVIGLLAWMHGFWHDDVPQPAGRIGSNDILRAMDWFSDPALRKKDDLLPWPELFIEPER